MANCETNPTNLVYEQITISKRNSRDIDCAKE